MHENEHLSIHDKHSDILSDVLNKLTVIDTNQTNIAKKLDSLEVRFDGLAGHRLGDIVSFKDTLKVELEASEQRLENRLEKRIDKIAIDVDKTKSDIQDLTNFKAEINGKIYGAILGVSAIFAAITFLINKFISV